MSHMNSSPVGVSDDVPVEIEDYHAPPMDDGEASEEDYGMLEPAEEGHESEEDADIEIEMPGRRQQTQPINISNAPQQGITEQLTRNNLIDTNLITRVVVKSTGMHIQPAQMTGPGTIVPIRDASYLKNTGTLNFTRGFPCSNADEAIALYKRMEEIYAKK